MLQCSTSCSIEFEIKQSTSKAVNIQSSQHPKQSTSKAVNIQSSQHPKQSTSKAVNIQSSQHPRRAIMSKTPKAIAETIDATIYIADAAKLINKGLERAVEA